MGLKPGQLIKLRMRRILYLFIPFIVISTGGGITSLTSSQNAQAFRNGVITGRVLLEDGSPVESMDVWVYRAGVKIYTEQTFYTDREGNFTVTGLVPGLYGLRVNHAGYINTSHPEGSSFHRIGDHVTIKLIKGGVITGIVTDANGEPMPAVSIITQRIRNTEGHSIIGGFREYHLGDSTDDRGIYRLFGLTPGGYILSVNPGLGVYLSGAEIGVNTPTYHPSTTRAGAAEIISIFSIAAYPVLQ
jgi:hypothetical protein